MITSFINRKFCAREGAMTPPDHQLPAIIEPAALPTPAPADTYIVPALIASVGDQANWRYVEFFAANLSNDNTRRAYARACAGFFAWCEHRGLALTSIRPFDVAAWIKQLQERLGRPAVKQQLAAVRMLFDWLVTGQIVPMNPAAAVRGPKHVVKTGSTPVLEADEWRKLIDSIPSDTVRDLRDRALIATLTYSFARITAALTMKVEDLRRAARDGQSGCMRKAARNMRCRAITRSPTRCAPISTPPASPMTARAFCSARARGTARRS
jgi:hypothetical protein